DYLIAARIGRFSDLSERQDVLTFEPAIDRILFNKVSRSPANKKKRFLFYTRPSNPRNMLGVGIIALRSVVKDASLNLEDWNFVGIGGRGSVPRIELGQGKFLEQSPWQSYTSYARYLSESEILLCLMLSPHTSYPVLEMAACGGLVVTNTFHSKTADALAQVSGNIIAVRPDISGVIEGVTTAIKSVNKGFQGSTDINAPASWHESLSRAAPIIARAFNHGPEPSWSCNRVSRGMLQQFEPNHD
ncbi:MAG TPA: hypothetical protein VFW75_11990, partial [Acetobacteraceae bacterium]|nr:hypothetical protein [Acetobacteraceae bacterium]